MVSALILGLGLLGDTDLAPPIAASPLGPGRAIHDRRGEAGTTFVIPRLSWPPSSQGLRELVRREPPPAPGPTRPAPRVRCTIRTLDADPRVDPGMARALRREVDPKMVVPSACEN